MIFDIGAVLSNWVDLIRQNVSDSGLRLERAEGRTSKTACPQWTPARGVGESQKDPDNVRNST